MTVVRCLSLIAVTFGLGHSTTSAPPAHLAYRFVTGEELVYELVKKEEKRETEEQSDRRFETKLRWRVYPIRQNPDGSWRLVVDTWIKLLRYTVGEEGGEEGGEEEYVRFRNRFLSYCDLHPDGAYTLNPTMDDQYLFGFPPDALITPLSPDPWHAPATDATYTRQSVDAGPPIRVKVGKSSHTDVNYELTESREITFDAEAGRAVEIVDKSTAEWTVNPWSMRTTYRLTEVKAHDPAWIRQFAEEADRYFQIQTGWRKNLEAAYLARSVKECHAILDAARDSVAALEPSITMPEVLASQQGLLALHDREREFVVQAAEKREALLSKPPVDWESANLSDQPVKATDFRGRVVILDFWYRGCGHCILALPKVKQLYHKYKDRGVVVLGVSNDAKLDDALHVVREFSIPYDSVRNLMSPAGEAPERRLSIDYDVNTWPTFIVLDQRGRVVDYVTGNAEDLVDHISDIVDALLSDPAGAE
ncbi:MAG: TlpA family protein disulfide reductase [Planctomycetales bacterium]|nr:TlpA family protein disulfide reductase [Planctomycetales bacterium]